MINSILVYIHEIYIVYKKKMLQRWAASASVYVVAELLGARLESREPTKERVLSVAALGATGDALCLRGFHYAVDRCLPHPILRTLAEQALYAPVSNSSYLTIANRGLHWDFEDFKRLYVRDCAFWSVASYVGYSFVPFQVRYLYVSGSSLFWSTWRSSLVS